MNDTPTPSPFATDGQRTTDAECWMNYCLEAEKGLTAVTEQRDRAREEVAGLRASVLDLSHPNIKMILCERDAAREQVNDMREKWLAKGQCCEYLGAELHEAIKQRDRAREEVGQLKSRLTQRMGAVTISRNGYVQELEQQRDRLAEIVIRIGWPGRGTADDIATVGDFAAEIQTTWKYEELEALQSLTKIRSQLHLGRHLRLVLGS
jgi:hypothetical protein